MNMQDILTPNHTGLEVVYECYPHLNAQGGTWIRGTIDGELNNDEEMILGIRTHPDDMKHPSLEGCSDFIPLENVPKIQMLEGYDSRANGPIFCAVCDEVEMEDELIHVGNINGEPALIGVLTCHDCEVLRPAECLEVYKRW
jgi:hypothetical protein